MGMNDTPSGERIHIGFFGRRNAGKSSLVNAVTGQEMALVSDVKGTTTDPVTKSMELLPLGPVVIIDTPGFDDEGALGTQRVRRTRQILNRIDVAVLVADCSEGLKEADRELIHIFVDKQIPFLIAMNKSDLVRKGERAPLTGGAARIPRDRVIYVSALLKEGIRDLKEAIGRLADTKEEERHLCSDLVKPGDLVTLVIPIDKAAPKGRLILPQQQVIRDLLDAGIMTMCVRETELYDALHKNCMRPSLVITDSQVFGRVSAIVPEEIPLTSFSILMARYKGFLDTAVEGVLAVDSLQDGDRILVSEGCTHHRQCGDIGTVKIPMWMKKYTGKDIQFEFSSGKGFPEDLDDYRMVIHCGGCMLTGREMLCRMNCARDQGVPFTNYGTYIAYTHGILKRSIAMFPRLAELLDGAREEKA